MTTTESAQREPYPLSSTPRMTRAKLQFVCVSATFFLILPAFFLLNPLLAATPKVHTVTLGPFRRVPYTQPDATPATKADETSTLKVRPLFVDDRQKEWTTGEIHDVTDRTFTVRRALRLNDALPTDAAPHWIWQPGPWLSVDRSSGHITALHLPDFDSAVSDVVWFRGLRRLLRHRTTAKGGLFAVVAQLEHGVRSSRNRSANGRKQTTSSPSASLPSGSACQCVVTIKPTGGDPTTYDVVGSTSLVEEGDNSPDEN